MDLAISKCCVLLIFLKSTSQGEGSVFLYLCIALIEMRGNSAVTAFPVTAFRRLWVILSYIIENSRDKYIASLLTGATAGFSLGFCLSKLSFLFIFFFLPFFLSFFLSLSTTVMRHLTMGRCSEKCIADDLVSANIIDCTSTPPDGLACYTPRMYAGAYCCRLQTCATCYCTEYVGSCSTVVFVYLNIEKVE